MSGRDKVIRASEIGQHEFCARAWWYRWVKGYRPANLADLRRGTAGHQAHGRRVEGYHLLRRLAAGLLLLAGAALLAWLLLSLRG